MIIIDFVKNIIGTSLALIFLAIFVIADTIGRINRVLKIIKC